MVSLVEILSLKDRLVGLLYKCLETQSSDFSSGLNVKLAKSYASSAEDIYFVFPVEARNEMLEICNRIGRMLGSVKPVAPPSQAPQPRQQPQCVPPVPAQTRVSSTAQAAKTAPQPSITLKPDLIGSKVDISTIPMDQIQKIASAAVSRTRIEKRMIGMRGMKQQDEEQVKMAVSFFMGSNQKADLHEVAKMFKVKTLWLCNALLDNGTELPSLYISKFPQLILNHDQCSLPTLPCQFASLAEDFQKQLTERADKWIETGNKESDNTIGDLLQRLNEEQRQDILDFYLKHRTVVAASWITEQACKKYGCESRSMNRCLAFSLLKKSGKDVPLPRKKSQLEGKEAAILEYARSLTPKDLNLSEIVRKFGLHCLPSLSMFLKKNGVQVLTVAQKRAKKLADQGLPYTPAIDPFRSKLIYEANKHKRMPKDPTQLTRKEKFYKIGEKKEMILKYVRGLKPEELKLEEIVRLFDLDCLPGNVSHFLKENGIKVMTNQERRAKKLAERGLPYKRAANPEVANRAKRNWTLRRQEERRRLAEGETSTADTTDEASTAEPDGDLSAAPSNPPPKKRIKAYGGRSIEIQCECPLEETDETNESDDTDDLNEPASEPNDMAPSHAPGVSTK